MTQKYNHELAIEIIKTLSETKKETLKKALKRNFILTSSYVLSNGKITVYKEGFYLELNGTRSNFSVYANDNDGELEITRKPSENKLHKLYEQFISFNECDFYNIQ